MPEVPKVPSLKPVKIEFKNELNKTIFLNALNNEYEKEKTKTYLIPVSQKLGFDSVGDMIDHYERLLNSEDIRVKKYAKLMLTLFDFIVAVETDYETFSKRVGRVYFGEDGVETELVEYREETYDLIDDILKVLLVYSKSIRYKPTQDVEKLLKELLSE